MKRITLCIWLVLITTLLKAQSPPVCYYQFNGNLNQSVGTTPLTTAGAYTINGGGPVGQYLSLTSISSDFFNGQSISPSTGFCVQMLFRAGYNFSNTRDALMFTWGYQGVTIAYPTIEFSTNNAGGADDLIVTMDGINRKTWSYLTDGNWHHLAFNYNGSTGRKEIWIDGQLPTGFFKTTNTGNITIWTGAQQYRFNQVTSYVKIFGDLDEIAIYNGALIDRQIYQNYLDYIAGNHYTTALAASVPAPQTVTGTFSALDFTPGTTLPTVGQVTQGANVTPLNQLYNYPVPRYKPGHGLRPMFNGGAPEYEGQRFQSGVSDAQATINDTLIQREMCANFNFYVSIIGQFQGAEQTFANNPANLIYPTSTATLRIQYQPIINSQGLPNDKYIQNSSGVLTDNFGNPTSGFKLWRPTTDYGYYNGDGNDVRITVNTITNSQTNRPSNNKLNLISENGEEIYTMTNKGLWTDPRIRDSVTTFGGGNYQTWYARKFCGVETVPYRDILFSGNTALTNCYYTYYALDGYNANNEQEGTNINSTTLPGRFVWSEARKINTVYRGHYMSTPDFYVLPDFWRSRQGVRTIDGHLALFHGWTWIAYCRVTELAAGDDMYSPWVAAGWWGDETKNVRPAQWLGLLKGLGVTGAETYYPAFFNLGSPYPNATNWIWQIPAASLAQGITSRYETLLRHSTLMVGDVPVDYSTGGNGYSFYAGDIQKLVVIRKDSTANKYVISGNINPYVNTAANVPDSGLAVITLAGVQTSFYVRRQGSVYYFNNSVSPLIFYQLDKWHENTHPYYWTKDFYLEGELGDTTSAGFTLATVRPNLAAGDFSSFTTYIKSAAANDSVQFKLKPRAAATYYLYVRAKSTDGTTTGFTAAMDFVSPLTINCITDTNWTWYRYQTGTSTAITYSALSTATHTFTLKSTAAKLAVDQVVLSTNANLVVSPNVPCGAVTATITPSGSTTFCQGGSVTLTANSATSYIWNTGSTAQSINVTTSGTYTVTVTISVSTASASTTVTVLPLPTATITPSGTTTFCSGSSVNLTASVNSSYLWSTSATTQTINVTSSGNYTVTVTGANGCTASSARVTVTVNPSPTAAITAGGPISFCTGGGVVLTATTGSGYAYQWNKAGVPIGGATASNYTVNTGGNYTVTTTAAGCSATSNTITVTILSAPTATITPSGATTFCAGGTVTLTGSANTSYQWSTGASTQAIAVGTSGTYTVTVSNGSCTAVSSGTVVTVNPAPTATITAGGSITFCSGGSVLLTAVTGVGYTYQWQRAAVNIAGATNNSYSAAISGNYTIVVTLSSCTATSNTIAVTVVSTPTTSNAGPDQSVCTDSTTLQGNTPASGTGAWTLVSGSGTITTASSPISAVTGLGAGANVFRWTITNSLCTASTDDVTITKTGSSPVSITVTANTNPFCSGATITFTALPVNGGAPAFQWKKNGVNVGTNSPTYAVAGVNGDLITCVLTSSLICGSGSPATSNTITESLSSVSATITPSGATTFCSGSSVLLSANTGSGLTYQWKNSGGNIAGQTNSTYTASTTETYTVVVTNGNSCSATSSGTAVTVTATPSATITPSGSTTFCAGGSVTLTAASNTSYLWSTGVTTQAITATTTGVYTVTVTTSSCTASSSATVTVGVQPSTTLTPSNDTAFCSGNVCVFSTPAGTGYSYQWYNSGSTIPGATTRTYSASASGTYYVIATVGSCTSTSDSSVVTVTAAPTATITPQGTTTFCTGDSLQLISSTSTSYLWNTGATTQNVYAKTSGSYVVTVTNSQGCTAVSSPVTIVVTNGGAVSITAIPSSAGCSGDIIKLKSSAASGNVWSTGSTNQTISVTASNTYTVTITGGNGCTASSSIIVSIVNCDSSCSAPTNIRVVQAYHYSVTLSWSRVPNASNYLIVITCPSSDCAPVRATFQGTQTQGTVKGLTANTVYNFTIQSACGDIYSSTTAPFLFKTTKVCATCAATSTEGD